MFFSGRTRTEGAERKHLRDDELNNVVDDLFQHHYDGHLDEEVRQTTAGMAL